MTLGFSLNVLCNVLRIEIMTLEFSLNVLYTVVRIEIIRVFPE